MDSRALFLAALLAALVVKFFFPFNPAQLNATSWSRALEAQERQATNGDFPDASRGLQVSLVPERKTPKFKLD